MIVGIQVLLAVAYAVCAHAASTGRGDVFALAAVLALVLMLVLPALANRRAWAWAVLLPGLAAAWGLYEAGYAMLPLLLAPVGFVAVVAWWFARSLNAPSGALISRIMVAMEGVPLARIDPALLAYTRALTAAWAGVLALLGSCNLVLALLASPGGLLDLVGVTPPATITPAQWSWFANLLNYGLVGGFFVGEYLYRERRFPGRYASLPDFLRKLAGLGPVFWRDLLR